MKTIKILLIIYLVINTCLLYSQKVTPHKDKDKIKDEKRSDYNIRYDWIDREETLRADSIELANTRILLKSTNTIPRVFKLQFYNIKDGSSNSGETGINTILQNIAFLNSIYSGANVQFTSCENPLKEITSDYYYNNMCWDELYNITFEPEVSTDAINIFYIDNITDGHAWARAQRNSTVIRHYLAANNTTLTHEIGHIFALSHTFTNTTNLELVSRESICGCGPIPTDSCNCETAADGFCDTQADPGLTEQNVDENTCQYTGNDVDPNGVPYDPPVENIMTYGEHECRTEFSPSQLNLISTTANLPRIQSTTAIKNISYNDDLNENVSGVIINLDNVAINSGSSVTLEGCNAVFLEKNVEIKVGAVVTIN